MPFFLLWPKSYVLSKFGNLIYSSLFRFAQILGKFADKFLDLSQQLGLSIEIVVTPREGMLGQGSIGQL